jgi:hypothetical protein
VELQIHVLVLSTCSTTITYLGAPVFAAGNEIRTVEGHLEIRDLFEMGSLVRANFFAGFDVEARYFAGFMS